MDTDYLSDNSAELTMEQQFLLSRLGIDAKGCTKQEVISALVDCWEQRMKQKNYCVALINSLGMTFRLEERAIDVDWGSIESITERMGFEPTVEEATEFMSDIEESATMSLDMEAIVAAED